MKRAKEGDGRVQVSGAYDDGDAWDRAEACYRCEDHGKTTRTTERMYMSLLARREIRQACYQGAMYFGPSEAEKSSTCRHVRE